MIAPIMQSGAINARDATSRKRGCTRAPGRGGMLTLFDAKSLIVCPCSNSFCRLAGSDLQSVIARRRLR